MNEVTLKIEISAMRGEIERIDKKIKSLYHKRDWMESAVSDYTEELRVLLNEADSSYVSEEMVAGKKCRVCGSTHIIKNGSNRISQKQFHCKDCGAYRVLYPLRAQLQKRHYR